MTQHMFAVFDSKADAYLSPFPANTLGIAERLFRDMVNQDGHQFNRHPEDYTLYRIGNFDSHTSRLEPTELVVIITGVQALAGSESIPLELQSAN